MGITADPSNSAEIACHFLHTTRQSQSVANNGHPNYFFCPTSTLDYRIEVVNDCNGMGLVANRDIAKGEIVFGESLEFTFSDVQDGDWLLLTKNFKVHEQDRTSKLPTCLPVSRKSLLETHGVPMLYSNKANAVLIEKWHLESPVMLMNHSCDPNVEPTSWDVMNGLGQGMARRHIRKGEQLTCDYGLFDYEETFPCACGADNCRGKRIGFVHLTEAEKEALLPTCSHVVKARHHHAMGKGPPVVREIQAPLSRKSSSCSIPRLVFPAPSCADVAIHRCKPTLEGDTLHYGLFAAQDFPAGSCVYNFWAMPWPTFPGHDENEALVVDMVSALKANDGDIPEGTVIQIDPLQCATRDAETRWFNFTGFDLLTHHSCQPNLVYKYEEQEDGTNWQGAYACRDINKGDQLFIDFNCHLWERPAATCLCGAPNCRRSVSGFRNLPESEKEELQTLNWLRLERNDTEPVAGEGALSPFIRSQLLRM